MRFVALVQRLLRTTRFQTRTWLWEPLADYLHKLGSARTRQRQMMLEAESKYDRTRNGV